MTQLPAYKLLPGSRIVIDGVTVAIYGISLSDWTELAIDCGDRIETRWLYDLVTVVDQPAAQADQATAASAPGVPVDAATHS